jgi:hypothetical protein
VLIEAVLRIEPHTLEVVVHDEVDDTSNCICAIHGRRATRQHFDAFDQRRRNLIQVRRRLTVLRRIARHQPAAVHQYQRALWTEVAQIDGRRARRTIRKIAAEVGECLRQVVDQILDARDAFDLHGLRADRRNRADAREIGLRNARAGYDDLLNRRILRVQLWCSGDGDSARCADEYTPDRALNVMTLRLLLHELLTPPGTAVDVSNAASRR